MFDLDTTEEMDMDLPESLQKYAQETVSEIQGLSGLTSSQMEKLSLDDHVLAIMLNGIIL
jgi:hypothetical protein